MPDGEGLLVSFGFGVAYKQRTQASSAYDVLEDPSGSYLGAAQGDLAVWTDYALDHERIRGWAPDGNGVRTIVESAPSESCGLGLSQAYLVSHIKRGMAQALGRCAYPSDDLRLWRAPRSYDKEDDEIEMGPSIPGGPVMVGDVRTWGNYAAFRATPVRYTGSLSYEPSGEPYFVVVNLSSWQAYRLGPTQGHTLSLDSVLDDTYFYFQEQDHGVGVFQQVVRIELSKLGSYGSAL